MSWGVRTSDAEQAFLRACIDVARIDALGFMEMGGELAMLPGHDESRAEIVMAGEAIIHEAVGVALDLYSPAETWLAARARQRRQATRQANHQLVEELFLRLSKGSVFEDLYRERGARW